MITQGKEPPPEYYERPELDPALVYLHEAFFDLTTERQIGMAIGPIPRSKIVDYGRDELGLDGEALERFVNTIREIDGEYLSMSSARADEPMEPIGAKKKRQKLMPLGKKARR